MAHCETVLRAFYEFWIERGEGPLVNPVAGKIVLLDRGVCTIRRSIDVACARPDCAGSRNTSASSSGDRL